MTPRDFDILCDLPAGEYSGAGIKGIRTVTYRAGASLEVLCHPIINPTPAARRELKRRKSSEAMRSINARNLQRDIMRLAELNFPHLKAVVFTGTYEYPNTDDYALMDRDEVWKYWQANKLPEGVDNVRKDVRNFLGRLRRRMPDPKGLKWILRIEESAKESPFGLPTRYHIHMLIEADGLTREMIEDQWPFGFARCDRFDLLNDGAARVARYLTKNKRCGRWVSHSRNLKKPVPTVSDRKLSRRRAALVAADVQRRGAEIFEKLYPGYRVVELPDVRYSDFVPGAYIYCRMRRRD